MAERIVEGKRPTNLEHAPNFLTQVEAASALGIPVGLLHRWEKDLPTFPKRQPLPYSTQKKFRRDDLVDWYQATRQPQELGA